MKTKEILNKLKLFKIRAKLKLDEMKGKGNLPSSEKTQMCGPLKQVEKYVSAKEISIQLSKQDEEKKDFIFDLISMLSPYGKKIKLIEFDNIFTNDDMRTIKEKNASTMINLRYMLQSYYSGTNTQLEYNIQDYCKILEKIEYLSNVAQTNFAQKDEQVMFIIMQLMEYISFDKNYKQKDEQEVKELSSLKGALLEKNTVCMGYAMACEHCLTSLGIECKIVAGNTKKQKNYFPGEINHAWNQVKLGDKWYNVDITWASLEENKEVAMKFLLVDDQSFKGHYGTGAYSIEPCHETYKGREEMYHKMKNIKNVLDAYDLGYRGTMLQYEVPNVPVDDDIESQKTLKIEKEIE